VKSPLLLALSLFAQSTAPWAEQLAFWSRAELQSLRQRLASIEEELRTLPEPSMAHTSSRRGFQSSRVGDGEPLWVELTWPEETLVDAVALIPVPVVRDDGRGTSFGFPLRHRIEVTDAAGRTQTASESADDLPNPDGYPVLQRFTPVKAVSIRVTATKPWQRSELCVFALSELMVFSGKRNVALQATGSASNSRQQPLAWSVENLTDHITPLGLPVAPSTPAVEGFHSSLASTGTASKQVTVLLPRIAELDEITLVPMLRREMPSWISYGFPHRFRLEVSAREDSSQPTIIADFQTTSFTTPAKNLASFPLHKQPVRAIRLTTSSLWERSGDFLLALSEIMAFAGGENVALHAQVIASDQLDDPAYSPAALTDGSSNEGPLLPLPDWLAQLQHRQSLQREHTDLTAKLAALRAHSQDQVVNGSIAAGGLLVAGLLWGLIHQHRVRRRDAERLRERLARDLHDEIGSNLGSIALISAFATQDDATPGTMRDDLIEVQRIARETADSMRDMVQLMSPRHSGEDSEWLTVLRSLATRLLRGTSIALDIQLHPTGPPPDIDTRRQLYLFCKEALHNAAKHSQARTLRFSIETMNHRHHITISDDGLGFDPTASHTGHGLSNLRERAITLQADFNLQSQTGQGTCITLILPA
jgi:signal transduction histidine kinase